MWRPIPLHMNTPIAAVLVALIGIIGISRWFIDIPLFRFTLYPDSAPMQPNIAVGFIASGIALWLYSQHRRVQGRWLGFVVFAIAVLTIVDYSTEHDFGIDRLFIPTVSQDQSIDRMSPVTLLNFIIIGTVFLTGARKPLWVLRLALGIVGLTAAIALLGFLYGVSSLYDFLFFRRVALLSALAFLLLLSGYLSLYPEILIPIPMSRSFGLSRSLLILCISVPVILGWGVLQSVYLGFFDAVIGIALLVVFIALVLSASVYWILLISNKTDLVRQELEKERTILEQERYGLLKRFVFNTRHDLATPLSIIITNTYLLRRSSDPVKQSAFLDRVEQETIRITHILDQFSEMMRLSETESLVLTDVDLKSLVELVVSEAEVLAKQKGVKINTELTANLSSIPGDPTQLHMALTQLFDNAVRYSQPEAQIIVKLFPGNHDEITFYIGDMGPGIEPEKIAHVFDLQYKGNEARTSDGSLGGFGLSIMKRIVDLHKGQIEMESILGQGTTVKLIFPVKL